MISEADSFSEETVAYAENVFGRLIRAALGYDLSGIAEKMVQPYVDFVVQCTAVPSLISEGNYRTFLSEIEADESNCAKSVSALIGGDGSDEDSGALLGLITAHYSESAIGSMLYDTMLFFYDQSYNRHMETYELQKLPLAKEYAETVRAEREAFLVNVPRDSFVSLFFLINFYREYKTTGLTGQALSALSDAEVNLLLQRVDLDIRITAEGYAIMAKRLPDFLNAKGGYWLALLKIMDVNDDALRFGEMLARFLRFLESARDLLTAQDISDLRAGKVSHVLCRVRDELGDAEKQFIVDFSEFPVDRETYDNVSAMYEGDKFRRFCESRSDAGSKTADDLFRAGEDEILDVTEDILYGICPTLLYLILK